MKKEVLKSKVIARLVKNGANAENAKRWVNEHFDYVSSKYSGVAKIAEVIMYL